jgi:hypothetical protein
MMFLATSAAQDLEDIGTHLRAAVRACAVSASGKEALAIDHPVAG